MRAVYFSGRTRNSNAYNTGTIPGVSRVEGVHEARDEGVEINHRLIGGIGIVAAAVSPGNHRIIKH